MATPHAATQRGHRGPRAKVLSPSPSGKAAALECKRRIRHVRELLANLGLDPGQAAAWVLLFVEEADPLMVLPEWLEAGWRDPLVVQACLRAFESREASQLAFDLLDWEHSRPWDDSMPGALLEVVGRV